MIAVSLLLAGIYTVLPALMGRTVDAVLDGGDFGLWLALSVSAIATLMLADTLDDFMGKMAEARSTAWLRHTLLATSCASAPARRAGSPPATW